MNHNLSKSNKFDKYFNIFLIIGIISISLLYSVFTQSVDILGSVASISGVLCVVLVAKGSIHNYIFGIINVSLYAYISYKASIYGDAALNALYYLPMQFIGFWLWNKRGARSSKDEGETLVKARKLTKSQRLLVALSSTILVLIVAYILDRFDDPQPIKDSITTVLSIIAQILMAMAFMEQWVLWAIVNVISVIMWTICAMRGDSHSGLMIIMWLFYLMNSLNGLRVWRKLL